MYQYVYSGTLFGVEGKLVRVEADISGGLPSFEMGGLLSSEIREARERVRTAMKNTGLPLPPRRIALSLAPADLPKSGTGFDLPIAAALMAALELFPQERKEGALFLGELELSGAVRPVRGVLSVVKAAREAGLQIAYVPLDNVPEASVFSEITVVGIRSLLHLWQVLSGAEEDGAALKGTAEEKREDLPETGKLSGMERDASAEEVPDFSQLAGMEGARRAAEIAAAGGHNLLLIGPPGSGKTMLASRIPGILPAPTREEQIRITEIYSSRGLLPGPGLMKTRPFRTPHHTITRSAMAGGGQGPRVGEITLAHGGVLFLDELPEFEPRVLETLRQPLEEGKLVISRSNGIYTFPSRFMLTAAMNPCKCGYYPDRSRCSCSETEVRRYLGRISRPLLDRFDLFVEVPPLSYEQLRGKQAGESSEQIRRRVEAARERQKERFSGLESKCNAQMGPRETETFCRLGEAEEQLLRQLFTALRFSARAYSRVLRLARTIADLEGAEEITALHLSEAAGYRRAAETFWGGLS